MTLAACARFPHLDWTIEPTEHVDKQTVDQVRQACANICASCPIRLACGATAEAGRLAPGEIIRPFGVLAELFYDGTGRPPSAVIPASAVHVPFRRLRTPSPPRPPKPINHGTPGGERTHKRRGEQPCADCIAARRAYDAERQYRRRQARQVAA